MQRAEVVVAFGMWGMRQEYHLQPGAPQYLDSELLNHAST